MPKTPLDQFYESQNTGVAAPVDKATAEQNLIDDAKSAEDAARRVVPNFDTLDRERQAVLVNMAFNLGPSGLAEFNSTIGAVNKGDYDAAADSMLKSKWAKQTGPLAKRLAERMRKGGGEGEGPIHEYELAQLRQDEGFSETPYTDTTGNTTVGYGRNLTARGETGSTKTPMDAYYESTQSGSIESAPTKTSLDSYYESTQGGSAEPAPEEPLQPSPFEGMAVQPGGQSGPGPMDMGFNAAEPTTTAVEGLPEQHPDFAIKRPVMKRPPSRGFMNTAMDIVDQVVEDAWEAVQSPVGLVKGVDYELQEIGEIAKATSWGTAMRAWTHENRRRMGIPMSIEEERSLANAMAIYKEELGDTKELKKWLKMTFHGGLSDEEWQKASKAQFDLVMFPLMAIGPAGIPARAGAAGLGKLVPNLITRQAIAVEAHGIASLVTYNVGLAHMAGEDKSDAALTGLKWGAAAPVLGYGAFKGAGLATKGVIKGGVGTAKAIGKPSLAATEWALRKVHLYNHTRNFLDQFAYAWDRGWILGAGRSGGGVLKKFGATETNAGLEADRVAIKHMASKWSVEAEDAMYGLNHNDRVRVTNALDNPQDAAAIAAAGKKPDKIMEAFETIRANHKQSAEWMEEAGVLVDPDPGGTQLRFFRPRQDFGTPHVIKDTKQFTIPGDMQDLAIKNIQKTHPQTSRKAAIKMLETLHKETTEKLAKSDYEGMGYINLQARRLNLPGYIDDPKAVLSDYYAHVAREIVQTRRWGKLPKVTQEMEDPSAFYSRASASPEVGELMAGMPHKNIRGVPQGGSKAIGMVGEEPIFQMPSKGIQNKFPKAFEEIEVLKKTNPRAYKLARRIIENQLGGVDLGAPWQQWLNKLAQRQVVIKLGLSQLSQLTQFGAPTISLGYRGYAKSVLAPLHIDLLKLFGKNAAVHKLALKSGAILTSTVRDSEQSLVGGLQGAGMRSLKRTGFTKSDTAARVVGSIHGATTAQYQAEWLVLNLERRGLAKGLEKKYIESNIRKVSKKFEELGIDPEKVIAQGGQLTEDDILSAALKISTDYNFWGDALSLPAFYKHPAGKFLLQFKSYSYQQSIMIKNKVIKPFVEDGDIAPMLRMLVTMDVTGEIIADLKAAAKGTKREREGLARHFENITTGGGFGILWDIWRATNFTGGLSSMMLGPEVGEWTGSAEDVLYRGMVQGNWNPYQRRIVAATVPMLATIPGPLGAALGFAPVVTPYIVNKMKENK